MKITTAQVNRILTQAQKAWGLTDWTIEWQFGNCEYEGDIVLRFTEKSALITLDKKQIPDRIVLKRTIYHEVAHCLMAVIERNLGDFTEHYIKDKKARDVFWERVNTDQNIVIDHIIIKVMGI